MSQATNRRAIILGAGIAGLTAGLALDRIGWQFHIVEESVSPAQRGGGMLLWGSAVKALDQIRGASQLIPSTHHIDCIQVRTPRGKIIAELPLERFRSPRSFPTLTTTRDALRIMLSEQLAPGHITFGAAAEWIEEHNDFDRVWLSTGESLDAELVIAADGVRSTTRKRLFDPPPDAATGYTAWFGVSKPLRSARTKHAAQTTMNAGAQVTCFPVTGRRMAWYATRLERDDRRSSDAAQSTADDVLLNLQDWPADVRRCVLLTSKADIARRRMRYCTPMREWVRDRVVLIGDAAHPCLPSLGLGGCLAIEDAVELANCLAQNHQIPAALQEFVTSREGHVRKWVANSRLWGRWSNSQNPQFCRFRNLMLRLMPWSLKHAIFHELVIGKSRRSSLER